MQDVQRLTTLLCADSAKAAGAYWAAASAASFSCCSRVPAILMAMSSILLPVGANADLVGRRVRRIVALACKTYLCTACWSWGFWGI